MVDYVLVWIAGVRLRKNEPDMPRPFKIPVGTVGFALIVAPGIAIAVVSLLLNGADYFFAGMIGLISAPVMYYAWKRIYGGLVNIDPEKYPINPRTKLAPGDLHRIPLMFGFFAVLGLIGCFFFPWYEGAWATEYYMETYGKEGSFTFILTGIKYMSVLYLIIAITLKILGRKLDPKEKQLSA
jgi:amino acid transporter